MPPLPVPTAPANGPMPTAGAYYPLQLPTAATPAAPDAQALLNPIFDAAAQRNASTGDALTRAMQGTSDNATARINSLGATLHAPSQALLDVNSIPQSAMTALQTRATAQLGDQANALNAQRTAQTTGLQSNLQNQTQAAQMARTMQDYGAQQRAAQNQYEMTNMEVAQQSRMARDEVAQLNADRANALLQKAVQGAGSGLSFEQRLALQRDRASTPTAGEQQTAQQNQAKSQQATATAQGTMKTNLLHDYLSSFKDGSIVGGDSAHPWASNQKLMGSLVQQYGPQGQSLGLTTQDLQNFLNANPAPKPNPIKPGVLGLGSSIPSDIAAFSHQRH